MADIMMWIINRVRKKSQPQITQVANDNLSFHTSSMAWRSYQQLAGIKQPLLARTCFVSRSRFRSLRKEPSLQPQEVYGSNCRELTSTVAGVKASGSETDRNCMFHTPSTYFPPTFSYLRICFSIQLSYGWISTTSFGHAIHRHQYSPSSSLATSTMFRPHPFINQ